MKDTKKQFSQKPNWIPCESQIDTVNTSVWLNWEERLFVERLEQKSKLIEQLLEDSKTIGRRFVYKCSPRILD